MIKLPQTIFDEIVAQAREEHPRECCGLLGGHNLEVVNRYALQNRSPEPEIRYFAAPEDLFETMKLMRVAGEELTAIYHSHPRGPAYPSPTDVELAFYPQAIYIIVALDPQTEMRAFRIREQEISEVIIDLVQ